MRLTLKADAKVNHLSFKKGENEVPEWCVASLRAAGLVLEEPKKAVKEEPKKTVKKATRKRTKKTK